MSDDIKPIRETPAGRRVVVTASGTPRQFEVGGRSVTFVPMLIKRRHRSKLVVPPVGKDFVKATSSFDLPLIRTLGKAFCWQRMIDTGEVANASELARCFDGCVECEEVGVVGNVVDQGEEFADVLDASGEGEGSFAGEFDVCFGAFEVVACFCGLGGDFVDGVGDC